MDTVGLTLQDAEWAAKAKICRSVARSRALFEYFDPKKTGEISYSPLSL